MTPIDIIATVFAILVLVKMILLVTSKKALFRAGHHLTDNSTPWLFVYLAATAIVGYYVLTMINITVVMAVAGFVSLIIGDTFLMFPRSLKKFYKEVEKEPLSNMALPMILWTVIAVWTLMAIFA